MKHATTPIVDVKKYGGKQVAIVKGKIVASGVSTRRVLEQARKKVPKKDANEIWLFMVPKSLPVIYRV
jgi:hypothetical protein